MHSNKLARYFRPYAVLALTLGLAACGGGGGSDETGNGNVPGTLQLSSTTHSATGGTDTTISITVTRSGGSRQGVSVGGSCILPSGSLDIAGTDVDTGTIDSSFIPVCDNLSVVTDTEIHIIAFNINPIAFPDVDTLTLATTFDTGGEPLNILYSVI